MNPFTPTFGVTPPFLAGRSHFQKSFCDALGVREKRASSWTTIFTGASGVGKTVMLNVAQDLAVARGWRVISETAISGLAARVTYEHLPRSLRRVDGRVSVPAGPLQPRTGATAPGKGILLTLDEIHVTAIAELPTVEDALGTVVKEGVPVAIAAAGLPDHVAEVLAAEGCGLLRNSQINVLGTVNEGDATSALRNPIFAAGRQIAPSDLAVAVEASQGHPFLIQLLGYHIWRQSPSPLINSEDVKAGVTAALRRAAVLSSS